jgi:multiple sugar transport system permease protein
MRGGKRSGTVTFLCYAALTLIAIAVVFPIYWLITTSLKTYPEIYQWPLTYWPQTFTAEHYAKIGDMDFLHYFTNSIIISGGTMLLSLAIGLLPAWAFSRYHFRGKIPLLLSVLVFQMFPMAVFLVPVFKLLNATGLLNTRIGLILAYLPFTTPLTIVFLRSFFVTIPKELEEAAVLDGCTIPQMFFRVIFPVTLPGIAAVGIYTFLFSWSELLYAMSILVDKEVQNIPTFLSLFVGQYQTRWGPLFAGSFVSMLPPLVIFLLLQRYFIAGLTAGSVKG